jgi:hypothetical protein
MAMPLETVLVVGSVCLMFLIFGVMVARAQRLTEKADATRAAPAASEPSRADNDNGMSRAA